MHPCEQTPSLANQTNCHDGCYRATDPENTDPCYCLAFVVGHLSVWPLVPLSLCSWNTGILNTHSVLAYPDVPLPLPLSRSRVPTTAITGIERDSPVLLGDLHDVVLRSWWPPLVWLPSSHSQGRLAVSLAHRYSRLLEQASVSYLLGCFPISNCVA